MPFFTKLVAIAAVIASVAAAPVALSNALHSRACANYPSSVDPEMRDRIYKVALGMKVSDNVMMAMMCTALTESDCNNLNCGDKDSLGIFQQRPSIGVWGTADQILNPEFAARSFLNVAIPLDHGQDPGDLAQAVQNAEAGNRYTMNEGRARELINQAKASVGGGDPAPAPPAPKPTSSAPKPKPTSDAPAPKPTSDAPKPTSAAPKPDPTTDSQPASSAPADASSAPGDGAVNVAGAPTVGASPASSTAASTTLDDGEECTAEYTPIPGDTCLGVAAKFNIALDDFYKWNPCIDSECQNLQVTFPYCVGVASSGAPSS